MVLRDLIGACEIALHCPVRTCRLSIRVVGSTKGGLEMDKQRLGDGEIVGGVDTHKQAHVAAVVDRTGRLLGTFEFPATSAGLP